MVICSFIFTVISIISVIYCKNIFFLVVIFMSNLYLGKINVISFFSLIFSFNV